MKKKHFHKQYFIFSPQTDVWLMETGKSPSDPLTLEHWSLIDLIADQSYLEVKPSSSRPHISQNAFQWPSQMVHVSITCWADNHVLHKNIDRTEKLNNFIIELCWVIKVMFYRFVFGWFLFVYQRFFYLLGNILKKPTSSTNQQLTAAWQAKLRAEELLW